MTSSHEQQLSRLQQKVWDGSIPLEIRLSSAECRTFDESDAYLIQVPRISYLPLLLPRIYAFFRSYLIEPDACAAHDGWFSYEDVPLKWHYPLGLLYDLYAGAEPANAEVEGEGDNGNSETSEPDTLPWKLVVHFTDWPSEQLVKLDSEGKQLLDAFRNSVKEAGFIRHSTGKVVMGLGYEDSTQIWRAVEEHDLSLFNPVHAKLLNPPGLSLKNIPIRLYLPSTAAPTQLSAPSPSPGPASPAPNPNPIEEEPPAAGTLRVFQSLVPPSLPSGGSRSQPHTLGTALNTLLPTLFPSRRSPLLALPVLHGAVVPLSANLEELARAVAYADGFLHVAVKMMG
ncbi:autophagy protein 5 [Rhizodiscina lignyota]|uniref:Autophagy protein 5 n=1 Tax=Rhizodiscina lignyota TaxID=1504668 RepID=A0A9P4M5Q8_9PEZI|nr:autophagy protein 5 [Rhizodiscina lignyota]